MASGRAVTCLINRDQYFKINSYTMKRFYFAAVLLLQLVVLEALAQSKCPYCRGTGTVVKNIAVSRYGLTDYKVKCQTCGAVTLKSSGHSHITCSKCGGTGTKSSISSGRSSRDAVAYDPDSPEGLWARGVVYTERYGLPCSEEEKAAVRRLSQTDPEMARNWNKYRDILNSGTIYFNSQNALGFYDVETVQNIDAVKKDHDNNLARIAPLLRLPNDLYSIYKKLYAKYQSSYTDYRNITLQMQTLRNKREQLEDYLLQKNLLDLYY